MEQKWAIIGKLEVGMSLLGKLEYFKNFGDVAACEFGLAGRERDGADNGVSAAAVAFADLGDVMDPRPRCPGVRADRDLRPERAFGDRNVVGGLGEKVIGNELVVALDAGADKVKADDAAVVDGTFADRLDRSPVFLKDRVEPLFDVRPLDHLIKRELGEADDDLLNECRVFFALDELHQLQRRGAKLNALCRRFVERPVDRMRPFDKLGEKWVLKAELLFRHACKELGVRGTGRVEKFLARSIGTKMSFIRLGKKRRLMMIEPPGQPLIGAVLEVKNGVLIAVELLAVEGVVRPVHRGRIADLGIGSDDRAVKLGKDGGGRNAVKAVSVINYPKLHSQRTGLRAKHFRLEGEARFVKAGDMKIRLAEAADAAAMTEFNQLMAMETEGKRLEPKVISAGVEAVFGDPAKGFYVVAEEAGEVAGGLMVTFEWSDWRNGWFWWIQSVYIRPEYRGRRLYSDLYAFVKEKAAAAGNACGFRLYVERENEHARRVYEKLGMAESHYLMYEEEMKRPEAS